MLHPAVKAISSMSKSAASPYTTFISSARAFRRAGSPFQLQYPKLVGDEAAFPRASCTTTGGGIPGTPCDMSRSGRVEVGIYCSAHRYALGMLSYVHNGISTIEVISRQN